MDAVLNFKQQHLTDLQADSIKHLNFTMTETGRPIQLADFSFTRETIQMSVPARFEQVSAQVPEQMALTGDGRNWTYAALNRQANQIAHAINDKSKTGMGCFAILADPSPEMVLAALGGGQGR